MIWFFAIVLLKPEMIFFDIQVIDILKALNSYWGVSMIGTTAYDSDAIIYVIDKMNKCYNLNIKLKNCDLREDQVRRLADPLANKHGKVTVGYLTLAGNNLTETSVAI